MKETLFDKFMFWNLQVMMVLLLAGFWGIVIYSLKLLITEAFK